MSFSSAEIRLLASSPVLEGIPRQVVIDAVGERSECQIQLLPDEVFISAGLPAPGWYLLAHGIVETFLVDAQGREKVLDFSKSGDTLAEETLFSNRQMQYSARSLTAAAIFRFPTSLLLDWTAAYPAFARRMMSLIAGKIDLLHKDILALCMKTATARLVCYSVCRFEKAPDTPDGSHRIHFQMPRNRLASRLGMTNSQFSRSLRHLVDRGLFVPRKNGYLIPDVPSLSRHVCPGGCAFGAAHANAPETDAPAPA